MISNSHPIHKQLEFIYATTSNGGNYTVDAKVKSKSLLNGFIRELELFGIDEKSQIDSDNEKISFNLSQHNNQTQTTTVSISIEILLKVFNDVLGDSEIEELKEILSSKTDPKVTKRKFIEKLKSFGENVSSNILANLVTNPSVWQNLSKML